MVGWWLNVTVLKRVVPGGQAMKANTALCLLLLGCGMAVTVWNRRAWAGWAGRILAIGAGLVAAASVVERLSGVNLHIDQLLASDGLSTVFPGRMSMATGLLLLMLSASVAIYERWARAAEILSGVALAGAMLSALSLAYGVTSLSVVGAFSSMAVHTAGCLMLLGASLLLASSQRDATGVLGSDYVGGEFTRKVLPFVIVMPPVVGYLRLWGQRLGWYGTEFGLALFAMLNVLFVTAVVIWTAALLDKADMRRRQLEADREDLLVRERAARERAEASSRAKDALLSVVSHELRTPLTPAVMLVRSMQNDPSFPREFREDIDTVAEQLKVETRIVNDLLDMANLSTAGLHLQKDVIDLRQVLEECALQAAELVKEAGIALKVDSGVVPLRVEGDRGRLQQILRNLLDNAIKFSPRGSTVTAKGIANSSEVRIEVTDTGVGIPEAAIGRIFEPFEQADSSTTRRFGGMGIGLTIARNLAAAHGGSLQATSPGAEQGATFILTLPAVSAKAAMPAQPSAPAFVPMTLLIVEDNPQTLKLMSRLLKAKGYTVITAESATAALQAAVERPVDVVVSDIGLPDMSGWELFQSLRQIKPLRGIAVSGFVSDEDRERSLAAGFHAHLDKPLDIDFLDRMIRQAAVAGKLAPV